MLWICDLTRNSPVVHINVAAHDRFWHVRLARLGQLRDGSSVVTRENLRRIHDLVSATSIPVGAHVEPGCRFGHAPPAQYTHHGPPLVIGRVRHSQLAHDGVYAIVSFDAAATRIHEALMTAYRTGDLHAAPGLSLVLRGRNLQSERREITGVVSVDFADGPLAGGRFIGPVVV